VFGTTRVSSVAQARVTPPAATAGIWRVEAASDAAVLKVLHAGTGGSPRWPASDDPAHPYYWRREALAYETGTAFSAPSVRAVVDRADGSVALWLDAVPEVDAWTPERLGAAARVVGAAQAAPAPDHPWLARGWLRAYLSLHGIAADATLARLEAAPPVLCHHDLHPANVLAGDRIVDWAYCGPGARGTDPGVLVADGIADEAFPAELAGEVAAAVWEGYVAGLRDAGWADDLEDVRFAFVHGTRLRLSWLPRGERPAWDETIAFLERLASSG
jgi:hypothetical protein